MPHIEIAAEKLFSVFWFPVTNSFIMTSAVFILLALIAWRIHASTRLVPSILQNLAEMILESFLGLMERITGSADHARRFVPIVATIFLFILLSNWLGILPGIGSIGLVEEKDGHEKFLPFFRSAASDLNVTLALGATVVIMINAMGVRVRGFGGYMAKFFPVKRLLSFSFTGIIDFFVGILEFISEFAKIISFSFRLFGNIFAGEVLLVIMGFLMPFAAPLPFLGLELFVGFVQALVFAMLTVVFISIAVAHNH